MFGKFVIVLVLAALGVGLLARSSHGAGPERAYVVKPTDTLWSIAAHSYAGDVREGVWKLEHRHVDLLASEEPSLGIPREPDHDLPLERLAGGRRAEPGGGLRRGDVGLLADALRPDDDVGQVEVDVRKRGQELRVEARSALVPLPAVTGLDELVHAIRCQ